MGGEEEEEADLDEALLMFWLFWAALRFVPLTATLVIAAWDWKQINSFELVTMYFVVR